jgi:protein TonB
MPTPPAVPAEPVKPASASFEAEFVSRVRALLNAGKRYPTGREASMQRPQGKVRVWFTLTRGGSLVDSGIQDSSNSLLLDNAALATVRRASFSAFPAEAWVGQEQHRFSADLEFLTPGS